MRWLFAVFLISLCALLWAAVAVARHIRRATHKLPADAGLATPPVVVTDGEARAGLQQDIH